MAESNLSHKDWCIACQHWHVPRDWHKKAGFCSVAAADPDECKCTPTKFVGRTHKGSFK